MLSQNLYMNIRFNAFGPHVSLLCSLKFPNFIHNTLECFQDTFTFFRASFLFSNLNFSVLRWLQNTFFLIFIFTLFYFTVLYWFCHTLTWIHHRCTWVPKHEPPLPSPTTYHLFGSSPCTSPKHPVSCIKHRLAICFLHDSIHISMPFSQIIPPSPSPSESKSPLYTSVSFLLQFHPSNQNWFKWILFNGWVILHCVYVPQLSYPFICW